MKKTPAQRYIARVKKRPAKNESCLQSAIVKWCKGLGDSIVRDRFAAIPNGWGVSSASPKDRMIQGARLKREGVRAGWPDLQFVCSQNIGGHLIGRMLFIEVKLGTAGVISDKQRDVHDMLREQGHFVVVVRDLTSAIHTISKFYEFCSMPIK